MVDTSFRVFRDTLLEEVGLALERDHVHEVEGVGGVVDLVIAQRYKQTVGNELDVLAHELSIHADEADGKSICCVTSAM